MSRISPRAAFVIALCAVTASPAVARSDEQFRPAAWQDVVHAPLAEESRVTLDEAVRKVRSRYGEVTILKAGTKSRNGGRIHSIKFLTEAGRVRTVRVDAHTGEIL